MKQQLLLPGLPFRTGICWSLTAGRGKIQRVFSLCLRLRLRCCCCCCCCCCGCCCCGCGCGCCCCCCCCCFPLVMRKSLWIPMAISDIRRQHDAKRPSSSLVFHLAFVCPIKFWIICKMPLQNYHALVFSTLGGHEAPTKTNKRHGGKQVIRVAPARCPLRWMNELVGMEKRHNIFLKLVYWHWRHEFFEPIGRKYIY